jgi:hypothetical protein
MYDSINEVHYATNVGNSVAGSAKIEPSNIPYIVGLSMLPLSPSSFIY